jgi:hypothetical protein
MRVVFSQTLPQLLLDLFELLDFLFHVAYFKKIDPQK